MPAQASLLNGLHRACIKLHENVVICTGSDASVVPSLAQRISLTWAPSSKAKFIQPLALPAVLGVRDFELLVVVEPCLLDVLRRAASSDDGTGFCGNPLDVLYDVRQHLLKHPDDTQRHVLRYVIKE